MQQRLMQIFAEEKRGRGVKLKFFQYLWVGSLFFFSLYLSASELESAQITELEGEVFVINEEGNSRKAQKGEKIFSDEVIETKTKSRAVVIFDDESRIQIGPNTSLKVNDLMTQGNNSVMLFLGRIFARVIPRATEEPIFSVQSLTCTAGVRGTDFVVATGMDGSTLIGVEDGEVLVDLEGEELLIKKDEEAEVSTEGKLKKAKRGFRTETEWEQWFAQRERYFIEHSEEVITNLIRRTEQAQTRLQRQTQELQKLKKQLRAQSNRGKFFYKKAQSRLRPQIKEYAKILTRLTQTNNKLLALDNIIAQAEEQIRLNPALYSQEYKDKILFARGLLEELNVRKLYRENRKMIREHLILMVKIARKYKLEDELWKNLPAKTRQQILNRFKEENHDSKTKF